VNHPTPHPLSFTRHEFAGAFGDLGTDLPLLVGVVLATGMDAPAAFVAFGGLQIFSGFAYRLPMPVQPLKAMAAIAIAGKLAPTLLAAGGLIVGVTMLILAHTGALAWLARTVPKAVVRGIQVGLGLQLLTLAVTRFLPQNGTTGWILAGTALALILLLRNNHHVPAALVVLALGVGYAGVDNEVFYMDQTMMLLADVLAACGVKSPAEGAGHVCFRGPKGEAAAPAQPAQPLLAALVGEALDDAFLRLRLLPLLWRRHGHAPLQGGSPVPLLLPWRLE
jgi:hypothetical protein